MVTLAQRVDRLQRRRWLRTALARIGWVVVALIALIVFAASLNITT